MKTEIVAAASNIVRHTW